MRFERMRPRLNLEARTADYAAWASLEKLSPGAYDLRVEVIPYDSGEKLREEVSFRVASRKE